MPAGTGLPGPSRSSGRKGSSRCVLDQVSAGVAVRMSVLYHLLAGEDVPTGAVATSEGSAA